MAVSTALIVLLGKLLLTVQDAVALDTGELQNQWDSAREATQSAAISLRRTQEGFYVASVGVFGLHPNVLVDTGSGDFWINSKVPVSLAGQPRGRSFHVAYGSGSASGSVQTTEVTLGAGLEANCEVGIAAREDGLLENADLDGVWGLAPGGGVHGLVECMRNKNLLQSDSVMLSLRPDGGSLTLGANPSGLVHLSTVGDGQWMVPLLEVSITHARSSVTSGNLVESSSAALLDSGSSGIHAPAAAVHEIAIELSALEKGNDQPLTHEYMNKGNDLLVRCESKDAVKLRLNAEFGEVDIDIPVSLLVGNHVSDGLCQLKLAESSSGQWVLGDSFFQRVKSVVFNYETRTVGISGLDIHQSDHGVMADAPKLPSMDDFAASIMDPKVPGAVAAVEASLPSSPSSNDAAQKLSPGIDANKLKAAADSARRLAAATAGALQAFDGSSDQSSETAPQTVSKWSNMREDVEGTMNEIIGSNAAIATPTLKGDPAAEEAYRRAERELAAAPEDMETASASAANAPPAPQPQPQLQPQPQYQPLGQPLTLTPDQALDDWWHPSGTWSKSPKEKEQELPAAAQPSASTAVVHAAMASNPQHESTTRNEVNEWTLDSVDAKPSTEVPVQQPENTQIAHLPAQVSTFFPPAPTSSEDLLIPASQAAPSAQGAQVLTPESEVISNTPSAQNTFGSRADLPNTSSVGEKQVDWSDILDRQGQNQLQRDVNVDLSVNDVAPPKPAKPMLRAHLPQAFSVKTMPAEEMKATHVEMPVASDVVKAIPDKISDEAASNTLVVHVDDQLEAMLSHTQSGRSSQPEEPLPMQHPSLSNPDDFTSVPGQPSEQPMPTQHPAAFNPDDFISSATKNVVETAPTTTTIVNAEVEDQPPEATEDEGYFDLGDIWKKAKDAARQLRTAAMHENTPVEAAHFTNEAVPSSAIAPFESAPAQVASRELASPVPAMVAPSSAFAPAEDAPVQVAPAELAPIPDDAPPSSAIAPFENTPAQVTSTELAPGPANFVPSSAFAPVENTPAQVAPAEAATSSASAPLENTPAQASSAVPVPPAPVEAVATDDNTPTAAAPQEVEEVEESIPDKVSEVSDPFRFERAARALRHKFQSHDEGSVSSQPMSPTPIPSGVDEAIVSNFLHHTGAQESKTSQGVKPSQALSPESYVSPVTEAAFSVEEMVKLPELPTAEVKSRPELPTAEVDPKKVVIPQPQFTASQGPDTLDLSKDLQQADTWTYAWESTKTVPTSPPSKGEDETVNPEPRESSDLRTLQGMIPGQVTVPSLEMSAQSPSEVASPNQAPEVAKVVADLGDVWGQAGATAHALKTGSYSNADTQSSVRMPPTEDQSAELSDNHLDSLSMPAPTPRPSVVVANANNFAATAEADVKALDSADESSFPAPNVDEKEWIAAQEMSHASGASPWIESKTQASGRHIPDHYSDGLVSTGETRHSEALNAAASKTQIGSWLPSESKAASLHQHNEFEDAEVEAKRWVEQFRKRHLSLLALSARSYRTSSASSKSSGN